MSSAEPTSNGFLTIDEFLALANPRCAVLGRPIAHSLSPQLHTAGYRATQQDDMSYYRVEAGEARELRQLLTAAGDVAGIRGFSVTMPGKQVALELADVATERALSIGTANTLVPHVEEHSAPGESSGMAAPANETRRVKWLADNTDVDGVTRCLEYVVAQGAPDLSGTSAVVIGNGGTARPAVAALAQAGVRRVIVLARSERALNLQALVEGFGMEFEWSRFDDPCLAATVRGASVAISTVPAAAVEPLIPALLGASAIVDVIYDPYPTPLLSAAREMGLPHADGLRMLAGQAEEQFRLFTGHVSPEGLMLETVLQLKQL
ncbi:shikimate dehydrogenase [Corynebacterium resistens]|uniref:shikimate dehydrogenase n=1 Tax=Corynebacterium resistens TaxID=258224 RepID=UPI002355114C|nr:shikimate dehydrogenase [Corynebacterium resistens]